MMPDRDTVLVVDDTPTNLAVLFAALEDEGHRVPLRLRELASEAGLSMLEAHRALGQLFDRKLIRLDGDVLRVASLEDLSASLD